MADGTQATEPMDEGDPLGPLGPVDDDDNDRDGVDAEGRSSRLRGRLEALEAAAIEAEYESGRREETEAEAERSLIKRLAIIVGGSFVVILGVILMPLPGPGLVVVAAGLGLLALEVPFAARMLDRVKERLPQDADGKLPRSAIVMMVSATVVFSAASVGFSIWRSSQ